jgi:tyrosinase
MALRKNQSFLTPTEKQKFVQAVLDLKAEGPNPNGPFTYDKYVKWHKDTVNDQTRRDDAHHGPAFFAWHRVFLLEFEKDLQRKSGDPNLGLPYWDWRNDNSSSSSIWNSNFMGGNGESSDNLAVKDGSFRKGQWKTVDEPTTYLRRQFGPEPSSPPKADQLPTWEQVQAALDATVFDVTPYDENSASGFRNRAEGYYPPQYDRATYIPKMHNRVHAWVGGSMIPITSPNDPVFFLHHCFMDKLWADWQVLELQRGGSIDHSLYLPAHGARPGHNLDDKMSPWNTTAPRDVLFNHGQLGYRYDTDSDMQPFDELTPGQSIWSPNAQYNLTYESGGNLVLYLAPHTKVWESGTQTPGVCIMEGYGTLVMYTQDRKRQVWSSNSSGSEGSRLVVQNNGKLAIYQPDGRQLWIKSAVSLGIGYCLPLRGEERTSLRTLELGASDLINLRSLFNHHFHCMLRQRLTEAQQQRHIELAEAQKRFAQQRSQSRL